MSSSDLLHLLERLLPLATAPFHERFVGSFLCDELKNAGLDFTIDEHSNIAAAYGDELSLACVAHMDHPGFEIAEASGKTAEASWFGGVDAKYFSGARAVFTRAEEQGFIGTLAMIRSGALPPSTKIISVETSKALPGVVLDGGPVIRLGDRASMFDHRMVFLWIG